MSAVLFRFSGQQVCGGICNITQVTSYRMIAAQQFPHQAAKQVGLGEFTPAVQLLRSFVGEIPEDAGRLTFRNPAYARPAVPCGG